MYDNVFYSNKKRKKNPWKVPKNPILKDYIKNHYSNHYSNPYNGLLVGCQKMLKGF